VKAGLVPPAGLGGRLQSSTAAEPPAEPLIFRRNHVPEVTMRARSLCLPLVLALAAAALTAGPASALNGCSTGQKVITKSYVFALDIGPVAQMYTPAQVKAKHPKTGEVMITGTMSGGMSGMATSPGERHLEVHICTPSGSVVMHAHPSIVISDPKAKTMTMTVPITTMEGIGEGAADYHYGNNVDLTPGHKITVTVTLNGQRAVFHTTVSKSSPMGSMG
jgi:hypothetical protein